MAVAGVNVYMFAPQTAWTMVGVTVAFNFGTAMATGEIFNCTGEMGQSIYGLRISTDIRISVNLYLSVIRKAISMIMEFLIL